MLKEKNKVQHPNGLSTPAHALQKIAELLNRDDTPVSPDNKIPINVRKNTFTPKVPSSEGGTSFRKKVTFSNKDEIIPSSSAEDEATYLNNQQLSRYKTTLSPITTNSLPTFPSLYKEKTTLATPSPLQIPTKIKAI